MAKVIQVGSVEDQIEKIEKMLSSHTIAITSIRKMIEELERKVEEKKVEPEKFEWPDERFETMFTTIVSERAEECSPLECEGCQYNIHDNEDGIGYDSCEGGLLVSIAKSFAQNKSAKDFIQNKSSKDKSNKVNECPDYSDECDSADCEDCGQDL